MSVLRPMSDPEFNTWLGGAVPAYAADKVASGQWAADAALELSKKEHEQLLPQGLLTADNHLYSIVDAEGLMVGMQGPRSMPGWVFSRPTSACTRRWVL